MEYEKYVESNVEGGPLRHFRVPDRNVFNFLPDEEVRVVSEGQNGFIIAVACTEIGQHEGLLLYTTPSGHPFVYDRKTRTVINVFYKDIKQDNP